CLVEDPATRRHQSRNYVETLEEKVALLEDQLRRAHSREPDSGTTAPAIDNAHPLGPTASGPTETEDSVDELSSKVGMLAFRVDGEEPSYLGSSSPFAFSRIIHSSLRQPFPRNRSDTFGPPQDDTSLPTPCLLPQYEFGITLSNAYFENIHAQYPFLHEPTFRRWEAMLVGSAEAAGAAEAIVLDPVPYFFINMVYAVGALLLPNTGSLPQQFYLSAQFYIDSILSRDNLEAIQDLDFMAHIVQLQAILCYAMYSLRSSTGPSIWSLSGLALRQCVELGYHRSSKRFGSTIDPLRLEMRKRVFWCTFGIESVAAVTLGRPLGLQLQEVDAEFPTDINDSQITETGISGTPRSSHSDGPTTMSTALHVFRLRCLWARMHTSLYSDKTTRTSDDPTYGMRVENIRSKLDEWMASIPPIPTRTGAALTIFATRDWYDLNFGETILLLYRGQLTGKRACEDSVFIECAAAAENICHGYRHQYIGKPIKHTWAALCVIFSAGLTYLHCLWTSSAVREAVWYDGMSSTLTDCTMLLAVLAERWKSAAPYRDIFEALSNRTITMMVDRNREQWTRPVSFVPSSPVNPQNLTRWVADIPDAGMLDGTDKILEGLLDDFIAQEQEPGSPSRLRESRHGDRNGNENANPA
ncbi:fungal-specific transcription factor domain-containing protein, partial [Pseudomassariella vexata]